MPQHYQFRGSRKPAWKLASCGIPVVLLYLGFTGDSGMAEVGMPFANDEHWQRVFRTHAKNIVPDECLETPVQVEAGNLAILIRSSRTTGVSTLKPRVQTESLVPSHTTPTLPRILTLRRSGGERFSYGETQLDFSVLDFWRWSASDLLGNTARGRLAEYIVARAIGLGLDDVQNEWESFDLVTRSGIKIEVKSSALFKAGFKRHFQR